MKTTSRRTWVCRTRAVMPLGLTVKWVTARTVRNVPSVPFTRTWLVEVVTKIRLVVVSLNAKVSCPW